MKQMVPGVSVDPTYVTEEIQRDPVWKLAFEMSELDNDHAPIGWGQYINLARMLLKKYALVEEPRTAKGSLD